MEKYYSFADLELAVNISDDRMYTDDRALAPFRVDSVCEPHRFCFEIVDALDPPAGEPIAVESGFRVYEENGWSVRYVGTVQDSWEAAYIRAAHRGREHPVQLRSSFYADRVTVKTVLNSMAAEHLIVRSGGVLFHSSYIDRQGRGILFTAPSETGKSTQADLWEKHRGAEIINGDRSAVRVTAEGVFACGVPFAGSSRICKNRTLPLEAIVYLKQAPVTTVRRLRGAEAFRRIWEGCSVNAWDAEDLRLASETVLRVIETVPVFELACTPDESAVIALEGVLK